ncbi:MAG: COX15/CtaA family protein [Gemmatimonadota bacterium]
MTVEHQPDRTVRQASHHRAFVVTVVWTLVLLFLGSVVHATESSLACPDWPTCYGSMVPEMEGGIFWEHLHRLVAGGLLLMFGLATWLASRQAEARWVVKACWIGIGLLLVQSVFGGLTVLMGLPDAVSTTHLGLAFLFLALAAVLATATSPRRRDRPALAPEVRRTLRRVGVSAAGLVFAQSVLGAAVRHTEAGMACGRGLLCNGGLLPPAWSHAVGVQWLHRVVGLVAVALIAWLAVTLARRGAASHLRAAAWAALGLVLLQVALGFLSAWTILSVAPVSLHTLVAASLLAVTTVLSTWGFLGEAVAPDRRAGTPTAGASASSR